MSVFHEIKRCGWVSKDPIYISYHDEEWGKPQYDSISLFEMLCLEGQQAGLSWITILKKRECYRKLFYNFNPHEVIKLKQNIVEEYFCNPGIVRHKGKIDAIINNAKCYIKMEDDGDIFSDFIWGFVNKTPICNNWKSLNEVPTETEISAALSKALKRKGFKFIGTTTCYAFMQACGLVNDHIADCFVRTKIYDNAKEIRTA